MRASIILIGLGLMLGFSMNVHAASHGPTPAVKCYAAKVKETAKYYACRLKAESKAIKKGETPDFSKCDSKYIEKWAKAETKGEGACPTEGDEAAIQASMIGDADTIVGRLSGVRFVDNLDGTVTDNQTGLTWEKKVLGAGCLHCVDDTYDWFDAMSEWISEVNGHTDDPDAQAGLGGHTDWRLPTIVELQTILLAPFPCGTSPCIDSIFGPTAGDHWVSSTNATTPTKAWLVLFNNGNVNTHCKGCDIFSQRNVRAVRGGP